MMNFNIAILGSGSKGNSFAIGCNGLYLLVDAGFSRKELLKRLEICRINPTSIRALLATHEHEDHIKGARVFCDELNIPVCLAARTAGYLRERKKLPAKVMLFAPGDEFMISGFQVTAFPVHHDAVDPVGFVIKYNEYKVGIATDLGCVNRCASEQLSGCDALLLESNYDLDMLRDSARPFELKRRIMGQSGHLNNTDAINALPSLITRNTKHLILTHVSGECNSYDLVERLGLQALAAMNRADVGLLVARQETPSGILYL